jgi:hypothetical protein
LTSLVLRIRAAVRDTDMKREGENPSSPLLREDSLIFG